MNPVNLIPMAASLFCLWACLIRKAPYDSFTSHPSSCSHLSIAVSCLQARWQERDKNDSGKLPWVTQLQLKLTLRQLENTHTLTYLSRFTGTFWIDSCLSLSTHLIFSPSNPAP